MDDEHVCTNRRQGPKTDCLLRRTEDRAKTVSFETPKFPQHCLYQLGPVSTVRNPEASKHRGAVVTEAALRGACRNRPNTLPDY